MSYEFDTFCEDCKKSYDQNSGKADIEAIRQKLERLLGENPEFIECGVFEGSGTGIIVSLAVSTGVGIRSRGYRRVCVTNGCILPISTPGPMYRFM